MFRCGGASRVSCADGLGGGTVRNSGPYEESDRIRLFERKGHPTISLELIGRGGVGQRGGQAGLHCFERLRAVGDRVVAGEV